MKCVKCGQEFLGKFCPNCGTAVCEVSKCPNCGKERSNDERFCSGCGYSFVENVNDEKETAIIKKIETSFMSGVYEIFKWLPLVLFVIISVSMLLFSLAPVVSFSEIENYSVYGLLNNDEMLSGSGLFVASIILTAVETLFLLASLVLLCFASYYRYTKNIKYIRVLKIGGELISLIYYAVLIIMAIAYFVMIAVYDDGMGMVTSGACPILMIVFSIIFAVADVTIIFLKLRFKQKYCIEDKKKFVEAKKPEILSQIINKDECTVAVYQLKNTKNGILVIDGESYNAKINPELKANIISIIVKNGVTKIVGNAFKNFSSLQSVEIPEGVTFIGENAFMNCTELKSIIIPDTVTNIGEKAFCGCKSLETVIIGKNVVSIGARAFRDCVSIKNIKLPDSLTAINMYTFDNCSSLKNIDLGNGIKKIASEAFMLCENLITISFPKSLTYIGDQAFCGCKSLKELKLGNGITGAGNAIFNGCNSFSTIYFDGTKEEWNDIKSKIKIPVQKDVGVIFAKEN